MKLLVRDKSNRAPSIQINSLDVVKIWELKPACDLEKVFGDSMAIFVHITESEKDLTGRTAEDWIQEALRRHVKTFAYTDDRSSDKVTVEEEGLLVRCQHAQILRNASRMIQIALETEPLAPALDHRLLEYDPAKGISLAIQKLFLITLPFRIANCGSEVSEPLPSKAVEGVPTPLGWSADSILKVFAESEALGVPKAKLRWAIGKSEEKTVEDHVKQLGELVSASKESESKVMPEIALWIQACDTHLRKLRENLSKEHEGRTQTPRV